MRHLNPRLEDRQQQVPFHALLWSLGKSLIQGSSKVQAPVVPAQTYTGEALSQKVQNSTVQQLTTSMRMHGIVGDDDTMLSSLENMVLAGEISFHDFIGRIQNLFPQTLDQLDVTLRMKIASHVLPE